MAFSMLIPHHQHGVFICLTRPPKLPFQELMAW
jgi:hypothetical protein